MWLVPGLLGAAKMGRIWLPVLWHYQRLPNPLAGGGGGHFFSNSAFLKTAEAVVSTFFYLQHFRN